MVQRLLNVTLTGEGPPMPDPSYRQTVRQRLHQRRRHLRKLADAPGFFGAPAMWAAFGAAATALLMVVLHYLTRFPGDPAPAPSVVQTNPGVSLADRRRLRRMGELMAKRECGAELEALCGGGGHRSVFVRVRSRLWGTRQGSLESAIAGQAGPRTEAT